MNVADDFARLVHGDRSATYRGLGDAIIESADDAIVSKDLNGIIRSWNKSAERLFGYTAEEAVGHSIKLIIPPDRHHEEADILARVRHGERVEHYETVRVTKDGRELPVSLTISPIKDSRGHVVGASKIARDITERMDAEHTRAYLAAIVESADDAIISKDLNGVIQSWNKGAERLFGYTPREAVGRSVTMLIPPERQYEEPEILARVRRGEPVEHYETIRITKDGRRIPVSLTTSPVRDKSGRIIGASKIARDVSERRAIENALKEADLRKDQFLAMLAHELRNPLTPIRTGLDIIQRSVDAGRREWAMEVIDRQLVQLTRIIDDLLEIARITSGNITLRRQPVGLHTLIKSAVESARSHVDSGHHVLQLDLPVKDTTLYVDSVRMVQAIVNLLLNAAKFTAPGGTIVIGAAADSREATIVVRDTGRGMDAALLPHIFDVFVQGKTDYARTEGGLGIGLSIVRRIVELHGGSVTAYSQGLGKGSEFRVRVPIGQALEPAQTPTSPAPSGRNYRILVVDDNRDVTDALAELLAIDGHDIERHYTGEGVLEKVRSFKPDVVLLDLGLPTRNGFDIARDIRAEHDLKRLLLIAVSGYGQPADVERTREVGIDFHLLKPVKSDELLQLIDANLATAGGK